MDINARPSAVALRRKCASSEHLDACDTRSRHSYLNRRCYRIAAKESGRRARKCIIGG
jgi:hypothetical protein